MPEQPYDERDVQELVRAARDAAEELFIITRLGSRRDAPRERWQRLVEALKPFATVGETPSDG